MATEIALPAPASPALEELLELETKIAQVADALRAARAERDHALAALAPLQAAHEKLQRNHALAEQELVALRKERHEVRQRVARLAKQLEGAGA